LLIASIDEDGVRLAEGNVVRRSHVDA